MCTCLPALLWLDSVLSMHKLFLSDLWHWSWVIFTLQNYIRHKKSGWKTDNVLLCRTSISPSFIFKVALKQARTSWRHTSYTNYRATRHVISFWRVFGHLSTITVNCFAQVNGCSSLIVVLRWIKCTLPLVGVTYRIIFSIKTATINYNILLSQLGTNQNRFWGTLP